MEKCKKCGSTNITVEIDLDSVETIYNYRCKDCGEIMNIKLEGGLPNKSPENNQNMGLMGWICPKCGRCYSPFTTMCSFCNNDPYQITVTY